MDWKQKIAAWISGLRQTLNRKAAPSAPAQSVPTIRQREIDFERSDLLVIAKYWKMRDRLHKRIIASVSDPAHTPPVSMTREEAEIDRLGRLAFSRQRLRDREKKQGNASQAIPPQSRQSPRTFAGINSTTGEFDIRVLHRLLRARANPSVPAWVPPHTEDAMRQASAKPQTDLGALQEDIARLFEKAESLRYQGTSTASVVVDLLRHEVSPLMRRAAEIGEPALREFRALEQIQERLMKALLKAWSEGSKSWTAA